MKLEDHLTDQRMHLKTTPPIPSKNGLLMGRRYRSLFVVSLSVTASVLVVAGVVHLKGSAAPSAEQLPEAPPRNVRVQKVRGDGAASESSYTGVVRARYESDLAFRVGGKVVSRHVELGERVTVGQPLFRLDPEDYELALKAAEADLAAAEAEVEYTTAEDVRQQLLHARNATAAAEAEKARAARSVAVARRDRAIKTLALARNRLSYCSLAADADGVVTELPGEAGLVVLEGQPVARLTRDGGLEAVVSLPENRVEAARSATAKVTLWSTPGVAFPAVLREVSPSADPLTRTYQARFVLPDTTPGVAIGMTATVHLTPADFAPGFVLPLSSLLRQSDQPAVWVVGREAGQPTLTPVEVREYRQESVVIAAGVKPGDLVVTAGVQKIDPGMVVKPWEDIR
ncbi:efflux RND transporter periplasmic adaptor subunit [Schlesneria sp. T3-172]|uniref:efflux RND transporter periplasmic adaptor subunit n=1 Tax=Schlesneria sphaerica TaxID=3373610 RepID=UPI0037CAC196